MTLLTLSFGFGLIDFTFTIALLPPGVEGFDGTVDEACLLVAEPVVTCLGPG